MSRVQISGESALAVAERFFSAIEQGDVETVANIYAPDAVIWHNFDPLDARQSGDGVAQNLEVLKNLPNRVIGAKYEVLQREATQSGFVQQHLLIGKNKRGEDFVLPACIVCQVEGGRITRLDEYFDPALREKLA